MVFVSSSLSYPQQHDRKLTTFCTSTSHRFRVLPVTVAELEARPTTASSRSPASPVVVRVSRGPAQNEASSELGVHEEIDEWIVHGVALGKQRRQAHDQRVQVGDAEDTAEHN